MESGRKAVDKSRESAVSGRVANFELIWERSRNMSCFLTGIWTKKKPNSLCDEPRF